MLTWSRVGMDSAWWKKGGKDWRVGVGGWKGQNQPSGVLQSGLLLGRDSWDVGDSLGQEEKGQEYADKLAWLKLGLGQEHADDVTCRWYFGASSLQRCFGIYSNLLIWESY